jgi:outer membrane protein OmpA-like peptidoglycan-associated protein/flagellar hook assembly protein FlgD
MSAHRWLAVTLAVTLWAGAAAADEGVTGEEYLRLPAGARSTALAGTYAALGGDAETLFYNPAGMIDLLNPQLYLSHLAWWDAVTQDTVWAVQPMGEQGALGAAVSFFNVPPFDSTGGAAPAESAWSFTATGGYARRVIRSLAAGGTLKFTGAQLGPSRAWGAMLDLGAKYYLANDQLLLAATLRNLGLASAYEKTADALPLQTALGAAYQLWPDEPQRLALAADLLLPWRGRPSLSAGVEGWLWNTLAVRAGATSGAETGDWLKLGAGVRWRQFHVDYAFSPLGFLGPVHHLAAGYDFATQMRLGRPRLHIRMTTKQTVDASGEAGHEVDFLPEVQAPAGCDRWELEIRDRSGRSVRRWTGRDQPGLIVAWDGRNDQGQATDREAYYTYSFKITDRQGYTAEDRGEILPVSVTKLPQLKVLPRDLFAGKVGFTPKASANIKEWRIAVVDPEGRIVRQYQGVGAIPKDFAWDGTDEQQRKLAVQKGYCFLFKLKDESGNEMESTAPLVQVDAHSKIYTQTPLPLAEEVPFHLSLPEDVSLKSWALDLTDITTGQVIRTYSGEGRPPEALTWDSRNEKGERLPANHKYAYVLRFQDALGNVWQQAADLDTTEAKVLDVGAGGIKLKIEQILFDFNKAELKPGMFEKLRKAADLVRSDPEGKVHLFIEGHTDEIGTDAYNYELSVARAKMVMRFLVEEEKLPSSIIEVKGYGKSVPFATGTNPQAQAMNRRVEITVWLEK